MQGKKKKKTTTKDCLKSPLPDCLYKVNNKGIYRYNNMKENIYHGFHV